MNLISSCCQLKLEKLKYLVYILYVYFSLVPHEKELNLLIVD